MIALIRGELAYKSIDHVIIDTGGVGYRLFIPLSTFYALPENGEVRLQVHTHVREDALLLFGFQTGAEKELFATLINISGIGPKLALNILRITSYNVCYTKLLRRRLAPPPAGRPRRYATGC